MGRFERNMAPQMSRGSGGMMKKKEGEVHVAAAAPSWRSYTPSPYNPMYQQPPQYNYAANITPTPYPQPCKPRGIVPAPFTHAQASNTPTYRPPNPYPNTYPNRAQQTAPNYDQRRGNQEKKFVTFTPIPTTYSELLP